MNMKYIRYTLVINSIYPRGNQYVCIRKSKEFLASLHQNTRTISSTSGVDSKYLNLNTVPIGETVCYAINVSGQITNSPSRLNSYVLFSYNYTNLNYGGTMQIAAAKGYEHEIAYRLNDGTNWSQWKYIKNYEQDVYDPSTFTDNSIINYVNGSVLSGSSNYNGYSVTDFIPVEYGDVITLAYVRGKNLCGGALYDENHNYIKTIWGTDDFTMPTSDISSSFSFIVDNVRIKYMRYNVTHNNTYRRYNQYIRIHNSIDFRITNKKFVIGPNGDFTKIKDCTEYIVNNHIFGATVFVEPGLYDLVTEYGTTYLENLSVSGNVGVGPMLGNNTHFIFAENARIEFLYSGSNENVREHFAAFNVIGSFILENANIKVQNARYCVHDDLPTSASTVPNNCESIYKNCVMEHLGNTAGSYIGTVAIGAGVNKNTLTIVDGGVYKCGTQYPWAISWHNANTDKKSRIVIKNAWINNGIRLHEQVANGNTVDVEISGCYAPSGLGGTHNNLFNIIEWNNSFSN